MANWQSKKALEPKAALHTVSHKKRDTFIFSITQTNIDRFLYFFTTIYNEEFRNKNLLKLSPHPKSVAALPCET